MIVFINVLDNWCDGTVRHVTVRSVKSRIVLPITKISKEQACVEEIKNSHVNLQHK